MKKLIKLFTFFILVMTSFSVYAQKYKSVEDTGKLNLEYVKVSNDIADYTAQLEAARNKLAEYQTKAVSAESDATDAAVSSSDQSSKAVNGSVKDAKKAKKKAKNAYNEAKDAKSANNDVRDQEDKINSLTKKLNKKQERKEELDHMRNSIMSKL